MSALNLAAAELAEILVDTIFVRIVGHLDLNALAAFGSAALADNDR